MVLCETQCMVGSMLRRHSTGLVYQVSGYVDACYALDPESIAAEYRERVAAAPSRSSGYIVEHDTSGRKSESRRSEELLAHRMFLAGSTISFRDWHPVRIVDFQTPLNAVRGDGLGKVDLLGSGQGLCVIELKVVGGDTPLNALLEAVGYCAPVTRNSSTIEDELRAAGQPVEPGRLSVLVLAPNDYWQRWDWTRSKTDWRTALGVAASTVSEATKLDVGFGSFNLDDLGPSITTTDVLG